MTMAALPMTSAQTRMMAVVAMVVMSGVAAPMMMTLPALLSMAAVMRGGMVPMLFGTV